MYKSPRPLHDITGQRFGNLEVLKMEVTPNSKRGEFRAICKCHVCGRTDYECKPYWVKSKMGSHTKSCGCDRAYFKKQTGSKSKVWRGYGEMGGRYVSAIKHRATLKKLEYDLDAKYLWELYEKQNRRCALSGVELTFSPTTRQRTIGNLSLDRIDSTRGYVRGNVQWTHIDVNYMKNDLSNAEFIDWCKRISAKNV